VVSRRDVGDARRGHYYAVMHWIMSEDSKRQWTHRMDRTLQRNLRLTLSIFGPVLNGTNTGLTHY